jgi:hypothetical protein
VDKVARTSAEHARGSLYAEWFVSPSILIKAIGLIDQQEFKSPQSTNSSAEQGREEASLRSESLSAEMKKTAR